VNILLDTHVILWWWAEPEKLSSRVMTLVKDPANTIVVSAASAWEISTKHRIGKLPQGGRIMQEWVDRLRIDRFVELTIHSVHAIRAGSIPSDHRDPFDRIIAAQSILEEYPVVSVDPSISSLGAERIWE
jgi:PIN domain nuclease of toxin-antitoxin system